MSYFRQRLEVIKTPALLLHIFSCFFGTIGVGISYMGMAWEIVETYENIASISWLMSCFWVPGILVSPFIGVVIDRYSRKQIIIFNNVIRIVALITAGILYSSYPTPSIIYILGLAIGLAYAFYAPAALAFVRDIAKPEQLMYANATVDMSYEVGFLLGMSLGGLSIAFFEVSTIFYISAFVFFLATLCTLRIKQFALTKEVVIKMTFYEEIIAGLKYIISRKQILHLYTVQLVFFSCMMTAGVLLTPFAKVVLESTPFEFGLIESSLSLGIIFGSLLMPYLADKFSSKKTLLLCTGGMCIGFLVFATFSQTITEAIILYGLLGVFFAGWAVSTTAAQEVTNVAFQGRVQTTFNALSQLVIISIYATIGLLSQWLSIRASYSSLIMIAAIAFIIVCVSTFTTIKPNYTDRQ